MSSASRLASTSSSTFEALRRKCLEEGVLYEDPDFPATGTSIYPDYPSDEDNVWKRPKDIVPDPQFIVDGLSRFDLAQGEIGDCWFVAAAAVIATKPKLWSKVVPRDQGFKDKYAGIFHFCFWRFGEWVDVIIDDRLPVDKDKKLRFVSNKTQPNEFWGPLLEKAFAKLHGSYRYVEAGHVKDGLVDMSGGMSETFSLQREDTLPPNLWEILIKSYDMGGLLGCSIKGDGSFTEEEMWNGLYKGHAYSITCVLETRIQSWPVKLLRVRNPWATGEWTGPWSDGSDEWKNVSDEEKKDVGLIIQDDGEFWMNFDDFRTNFHHLDIVHLGPQEYSRIDKEVGMRWHEESFHGSWVKGVSSGGCGLLGPNQEIYYTNPQYYFVLEKPDVDDVSAECTVVISLLQKDYRSRKTSARHRGRLIVGFDVHGVKSTSHVRLEPDNLDRSVLKKQFSTRTPLREVTCRLCLDPGQYCIIPNTMMAGQEGNFLLRVYTYAKAKDAGALDTTTSQLPASQGAEAGPPRPVGTLPSDLFWKYAGDEHVVDARDLRDLINVLSKQEFKETATFSIEACRSLIAMSDKSKDQGGVLDYDEMCTLWDEILLWRQVFNKYDKDKSGCIETYQLKKALKQIGIVLSLTTLSSLATRYGGKVRTLFFEDFVLCLARIMSLFTSFKEYSQNSPGEARIGLDQWLATMLYM